MAKPEMYDEEKAKEKFAAQAAALTAYGVKTYARCYEAGKRAQRNRNVYVTDEALRQVVWHATEMAMHEIAWPSADDEPETEE